MAQYLTGAGGIQLAIGGATNRGFYGTTASETLIGTVGNDSFRGAGGGDILKGGAGDDTYNIYDIHDLAIENANEGVDTVVTTVSYTLGANIENLTLLNNQTYGGGNALGNIISGSAGAQILDGKGGDDILTGGAGADIFVMSQGGGHDAITDFQNGVDTVRLDNFGLTSFGQVQGLMVQQGADVALNLPTGDEVLFRNHQLSDFTASDFRLQLDTSKLTMTFDDEFDSLSLNTGAKGSAGTWRTMYGGNPIQGRTLSSNGEQQIYVDADYTGTGTTPLGVNPFSLHNGILDITAAPASAAVSAAMAGYQYTSGQLNTRYTFAQQYGYFEVKAKLPAGQGLWPAFWMVPANGSWPPEIDIFEQLGKDPSTIYQTSHSTARTTQQQVAHLDNPDQFHTYGMLWDQNYLVWYIDGVEVGRQTTPSDMNQPMYMVLNLAVGGSWPGNADATTPFPATMSIDYVHAYQLNGQVSTPPTTTTPPPVTSTTTPPATTTTPPVNHAPVTVSGSISGAEDKAMSGSLSATDQDGNALTYSVVSGPQHGTVTLNGAGTYVYTPNANYNGPDSFTFKANDGSVDSNVATVTLTVTPVNDAPVATGGSAAGAEDKAISGTVSAVDPDGDALTYSVVSGPQHGVVTVNSSGGYTYTPTANYSGSDSFSFKANDGKIDSNVATINLTVTAVNDAPVVVSDSATVKSGASVSISAATLLANDTDPDGDKLTVTGVAMGANPHGTVTLTNGVVTYTAKAGYTGSDSITYYVSDGHVTSPVAGTVNLTVTAASTSTPAPAPVTLTGHSTTESFTLKLTSLNTTSTGVVAAVTAFGGAGGWFASDNDFLALGGFSKGSTLSWDHDAPTNSHLGYYRVHDAATNHDFMITVNSTNGHHLGTGDFNFY